MEDGDNMLKHFLILLLTLCVIACSKESTDTEAATPVEEQQQVVVETQNSTIINNLKDRNYVKQWQEPVIIETDFTGNSSDPKVAADGNGNAFAVWSQVDSTHRNIVVSRYELGKGWGTPITLHTNASYPEVTANSSGQAVVLVSNANDLLSFHFDPATGWGQEKRISLNLARDPRAKIEMDNNGNAIAVWKSKEGAFTAIWSNRYEPTKGWGQAQIISGADEGNAKQAEIAISESGNAMAIWSKGTFTQSDIWASEYRVGSGWATPALVEKDNQANSIKPKLTLDLAGNATAVWLNSGEGAELNVFANLYDSSTGWQQPAAIESLEGRAQFLSLAGHTNGNAIAIWTQIQGGSSSIYSSRYTNGRWIMNEPVVNNVPKANLPKIAFDNFGNAQAVWQQYNGRTFHIWSSYFTPGRGWAEPELIEENTTVGVARNPQISISGLGNAIAVWQKSDGSRNNISANKLE